MRVSLYACMYGSCAWAFACVCVCVCVVCECACVCVCVCVCAPTLGYVIVCLRACMR